MLPNLMQNLGFSAILQPDRPVERNLTATLYESPLSEHQSLGTTYIKLLGKL
jgi:hypothetical protein